MYVTCEYATANGLSRKQVIWDYIVATAQHARVSFDGRTDESGRAKPPPFEGDCSRARLFDLNEQRADACCRRPRQVSDGLLADESGSREQRQPVLQLRRLVTSLGATQLPSAHFLVLVLNEHPSLFVLHFTLLPFVHRAHVTKNTENVLQCAMAHDLQ